MKVLIYKRTHKGDPNRDGIFGNQDCMGSVRNWEFDAVIGIGGKVPWAADADIQYKINWVGIGPHRDCGKTDRGDLVRFNHFKLYEEKGENIKERYPNLYGFMYGSRKRFSVTSNLPEDVIKEVNQILNLISNCRASEGFVLNTSNNNEKIEESTCASSIKDSKLELTINEC